VAGELIEPFQQRFPWWGPDLQTIRDTLLPPGLPQRQGERILIEVGGGDRLLGWLELPARPAGSEPLALVLLLPGLGGCSDGVGPRRLSLALRQAGLAVLRLNLRGAGAGRGLARGSYSARCNSDLLPVLQWARRLALGRPLFAVGLSLGGTMLLNAVLEEGGLDGLVCLSSPLDLADCMVQIERPRNVLYQRWLVRRLCRQTLADPLGLRELERRALTGPTRPRSIRGFDGLITAPRWGYGSVEHYYQEASPLLQLQARAADPRMSSGSPRLTLLPPTLVLHAIDDPWVPVAAARQLAELQLPGVEVLLTAGGGHNGFHARCDRRSNGLGNWGDRLTARWFERLLAE
jgi:predicted alpha/beta-fold hydrolase